MPEMNSNNIDPNIIIAKLQARLGEAMTVIAVLESQVETARAAQHHTIEDNTPED